MRIGFIGTGTMGTPIAGCLVAAGHQLTAYDIRREATATLSGQGAAVGNSPRVAAETAEAVFTSLPGPAEVESVALDPETGILAGLRRGTAYIDLTTNAPATIRRLAAAAAERGIAFLDAPVSGRPPNMTVMAGGAKEDFARLRPLLETIGKNVFHVGPQGAGCVAKLVTQYLGYTNFIAALEGLVVAKKAGIDLAVLAKIVPVSAGQSRTFDTSAQTVISRAFASNGSLNIIAKDMELAVSLAREVGAPATLGALALDAYKRAQVLGHGGEGYPAAAKVFEAMAGVELTAEPQHE